MLCCARLFYIFSSISMVASTACRLSSLRTENWNRFIEIRKREKRSDIHYWNWLFSVPFTSRRLICSPGPVGPSVWDVIKKHNTMPFELWFLWQFTFVGCAQWGDCKHRRFQGRMGIQKFDGNIRGTTSCCYLEIEFFWKTSPGYIKCEFYHFFLSFSVW